MPRWLWWYVQYTRYEKVWRLYIVRRAVDVALAIPARSAPPGA
jgi:hypothetical protein